jgi:hypothetical protein
LIDQTAIAGEIAFAGQGINGVGQFPSPLLDVQFFKRLSHIVFHSFSPFIPFHPSHPSPPFAFHTLHTFLYQITHKAKAPPISGTSC